MFGLSKDREKDIYKKGIEIKNVRIRGFEFRGLNLAVKNINYNTNKDQEVSNNEPKKNNNQSINNSNTSTSVAGSLPATSRTRGQYNSSKQNEIDNWDRKQKQVYQEWEAENSRRQKQAKVYRKQRQQLYDNAAKALANIIIQYAKAEEKKERRRKFNQIKKTVNSIL